MAIEDDDIRAREVWTRVSRYWYARASHQEPTVGRLYHHLAILARPSAIQQLFYYTKSLCLPHPFAASRETIFTMPVFDGKRSRLCELDTAFLRAHMILFTRRGREDLDGVMHALLQALEADEAAWARKPWIEKL